MGLKPPFPFAQGMFHVEHALPLLRRAALGAAFAAALGMPCPAATPEKPAPRAVVREWDHYVGAVPRKVLEHTFVVENQGEGLLEVLYAQTPASHDEGMEVDYGPMALPGKSLEVRVRYNAAVFGAHPFARHVILGTNDPARPRIPLRLRGVTQYYVQALPLVWDVSLQSFRGESLGRTYVLHSETRHGFTPGKPEASSKSLAVKLEQVKENYRKVDCGMPQFPNIVARRGDWLLSIKTSAEAPAGDYRNQFVRVPTDIPEQPFVEFSVQALIRDLPRERD